MAFDRRGDRLMYACDPGIDVIDADDRVVRKALARLRRDLIALQDIHALGCEQFANGLRWGAELARHIIDDERHGHCRSVFDHAAVFEGFRRFGRDVVLRGAYDATFDQEIVDRRGSGFDRSGIARTDEGNVFRRGLGCSTLDQGDRFIGKSSSAEW